MSPKLLTTISAAMEARSATKRSAACSSCTGGEVLETRANSGEENACLGVSASSSEDALDTLAYYELAERYAEAHNIPADDVLSSIAERVLREGERPALEFFQQRLLAAQQEARTTLQTSEASAASPTVAASASAALVPVRAASSFSSSSSSCSFSSSSSSSSSTAATSSYGASQHRLRSDQSLGFESFSERIVSCILSYLPSRQKASRVCKHWQEVLTRMQRNKHIQTLAARAELQLEVAVKIEAALYDRCDHSINQSYREKLKQLLNNLRVSQNADLRENVLTGQIPAETLVRMSAHELASKELVSLKAKWRQESLDDARKTMQLMNVTENFECPNCGHRRSQYQFWRRKTIVDRCKMLVKCLECRYKWEP